MPAALSGIMTPMTPPSRADLEEGADPTRKERLDAVAGSPSPDVLAARLQAEIVTATPGRYRSSIAQSPQLVQAVCKATRRKQSMMQAAVAEQLCGSVKAEDRDAAVAKARQSVSNACRLHRMSVIQAAEVLEAAGIGVKVEPLEGALGASAAKAERREVDGKLRLVQKAVDIARQRHRQSVVAAARNVACAPVGEHQGCSADGAVGKTVAQAKIQKAVSAAYAEFGQRKREATSSGKVPVLGAPLALLQSRTVPGKPAHFVHCGPARVPRYPGACAAFGSA